MLATSAGCLGVFKQIHEPQLLGSIFSSSAKVILLEKEIKFSPKVADL